MSEYSGKRSVLEEADRFLSDENKEAKLPSINKNEKE